MCGKKVKFRVNETGKKQIGKVPNILTTANIHYFSCLLKNAEGGTVYESI
jgi:hypothetical protein